MARRRGLLYAVIPDPELRAYDRKNQRGFRDGAPGTRVGGRRVSRAVRWLSRQVVMPGTGASETHSIPRVHRFFALATTILRSQAMGTLALRVSRRRVRTRVLHREDQRTFRDSSQV